MVAFDNKVFTLLFAAAVANLVIAVVLAVPPEWAFPSRTFLEHSVLFAAHCGYSVILPSLLIMFYFGEIPGKWAIRIISLVGVVLFFISGILCTLGAVKNLNSYTILQFLVIGLLFVVGVILAAVFMFGMFIKSG